MPIHYLNQWWNIVNSNLRNKTQRDFNRNPHIFIQENAFENVVSKMGAIFSQPECVYGKNSLYVLSSTNVWFTRRYRAIKQRGSCWWLIAYLALGHLQTSCWHSPANGYFDIHDMISLWLLVMLIVLFFGFHMPFLANFIKWSQIIWMQNKIGFFHLKVPEWKMQQSLIIATPLSGNII